jgi:hypothetical protein
MAGAVALAAVGITINGWFARSLGATDAAGWLFLAIGLAADLVAFVLPSCAAGLWQARQRATSLAGWAVWAVTFEFAVTAGIGFASTNIADVTLARHACRCGGAGRARRRNQQAQPCQVEHVDARVVLHQPPCGFLIVVMQPEQFVKETSGSSVRQRNSVTTNLSRGDALFVEKIEN